MLRVRHAVQKYFKGPMSWPETILALAGSVCMMMPGTKTDIIGIVVLGVIYGTRIMRAKKMAAVV